MWETVPLAKTTEVSSTTISYLLAVTISYLFILHSMYNVELQPYFLIPITMLKCLEVIEKELQTLRDWDYAWDILLIIIFLYMYFTF
ncbi:hypothetical protein [Pontibacillus yanchengensis]|uniref:Uncharacterized protein n=1 Tax=Pontibacillus yanchengensis Y32 TaxID=1385514 RepID=A0A0A2T739_9BACI|nr:hypothetical protein [Pontibacillus yanchengensis]KGP71304.1 hypothetical protein N782_20070 [Pontibacillus yanchengensis Y32]